MTTVEFGWLIRSIHSWSANLMVFFAFVHLATVYFVKAYRKPREITWLTGCALLFLAMAFGFSGYLLPWNQLAFFATKVGTDIAGSVPLIGEWLLRFLRGGDRVGGGTLSRFYGWHVAILPAITVALLGVHVLLVQLQGMSVPPGAEKQARQRRPMKFFPSFVLRDLFGWVLALGVLAAVAALFPWELGEKADAFAPAYKDIRPEWYFVFMFETLKLVPGGEILGNRVRGDPDPAVRAGRAVAGGGAVPGSRDRADRPQPRLHRGRRPGAGLHRRHDRLGVSFLGAGGGRVPDAAGDGGARVGNPSRAGRGRAMRTAGLLVAAVLLALLALPAAAAKTTSCIACHGDADMFDGAELAIVTDFAGDVHAEVGLSCQDCHGGNPDPGVSDDFEAAMDAGHPGNPYRGAPAKAEQPRFCGSCHSDPKYMRRFAPDARVDQEAEYATSQHGLSLAAGDTAVAACVDCHGNHGIRRTGSPESSVYPTAVAETCGGCHADAERMAAYRLPDGRPLPVDQLARWQISVHGQAMNTKGDTSAPTCNDCHGNHGAMPPGLDAIGFVCGQCHGREADLFRASTKYELYEVHRENLAEAGAEGCAACHEAPEPQAAFDRLNPFDQCASCHGNHAIVRPTLGILEPMPETPCAFCHEGLGPLAGATPELESVRAAYDQRRNDLLQEAGTAGLAGEELYDWMVERSLELPNHTRPAGAEGELELRPEFHELFDKFRIGPIHFTYPDPVTDEPVRQRVIRCGDCHAAEPLLADEPRGLQTSAGFVDRVRELTSLSARAERTVLRARRGGVETHDALLELDQAVDAQIGLEVLVHGFSLEPGGQFLETHAAGLEHAGAALAAGERALDELAFRRRGLALALVVILVVLLGLGLKIRQISARDATASTPT